jgi:hypothetical protein
LESEYPVEKVKKDVIIYRKVPLASGLLVEKRLINLADVPKVKSR